MALTENERIEARRLFTAALMKDLRETSLTKPDIKAAADAIDAWIDSNAANFNQSLPLPFRTTASAREKALLFMLVANRRFEVI